MEASGHFFPVQCATQLVGSRDGVKMGGGDKKSLGPGYCLLMGLELERELGLRSYFRPLMYDFVPITYPLCASVFSSMK